MTVRLGEPIASGSRSTVHALGNDAVVKVPMPETPESWIRIEAEYSAAVHGAGAPVPEFLGFDEHEGRAVSIYRRAFGERMWDTVLDDPGRAEEHGRRLAGLQELFASLTPPIALPNQTDRIRSKIRIAARFADPALETALAVVPHVGRVALCHGDLHPSNVILGVDGAVVVDWFDASRGDPVGDVARTTVLLGIDKAQQHLAGARHDLMTRVRLAYTAAAAEVFDFDPGVLGRWQIVVAAARVAEGLPAPTMRDVWRRWAANEPDPGGDAQPSSSIRRSGSNTAGEAANTRPPFSGQGSSSAAPASAATSAPAE